MPVVNVEPTKEHPVPYDLSEEKASTPVEEVAVAGNTVELQVSLGASLEVSEENAEREQALIRAVTERKKGIQPVSPTHCFCGSILPAYVRSAVGYGRIGSTGGYNK